ncbi:MAG: DUF3501 family protein [Pseudomonadales bacterium]|jgi:hypothetical protein|nr:DUF3501 family protein [Pseudomonadota bacterium]MDA0958874.1 DUF3501 family protein [Pseudomonadota bacterium]
MLQRTDLWTLEDYSIHRTSFREAVLAHKKDRRVRLGEHVQLIFEDQLTIKYQIQEMLRIEKVFEANGIQEELDAYNPLIPDGTNWKCTMLIQYEDVEERKRRLASLIGIEDKIWVQIGDGAKIWPIADEDMDRSNDDKTAAVHFMRYEIPAEDRAAAQAGADIVFGVEHVAYPCDVVTLPAASKAALVKDFGH